MLFRGVLLRGGSSSSLLLHHKDLLSIQFYRLQWPIGCGTRYTIFTRRGVWGGTGTAHSRGSSRLIREYIVGWEQHSLWYIVYATVNHFTNMAHTKIVAGLAYISPASIDLIFYFEPQIAVNAMRGGARPDLSIVASYMLFRNVRWCRTPPSPSPLPSPSPNPRPVSAAIATSFALNPARSMAQAHRLNIQCVVIPWWHTSSLLLRSRYAKMRRRARPGRSPAPLPTSSGFPWF